MKTIILAGGLGTRLEEETTKKPKPMVEIGGKPILWHIMSVYSAHGFNDFVVACGYKGEMIKEYFANFFLRNNDWNISLRDGSHEIVNHSTPDWNIELIDTGLNTMTGGRIGRLKEQIGSQRFMVTYGDGLCDVNISELVAFHEAHGKLATLTAVHPPARFGGVALNGDQIAEFSEKPQTDEGWINGGFLVCEAGVFDYLEGDDVPFERAPLENLAAAGELMAFRHTGFWQPMDTIREKRILEELWSSGKAPWCVK